MAQQGPPTGWTPVQDDTAGWTPVQEAAATPPPQDSALSRFGQGLLRTNPISAAYALGSGLLSDPKGTVDQAVFQPAQREAGLAKQAYQQGRPLAALGHAVGAVPLVGPALASPVERARTGDVAGGLGEAAGTAATLGLLKPTAEAVGGTAADVGRAIPGVSAVMESAGERANRFSTRKMTQATAPPSGPNKANLTAVAQRIAPQLARSPELAGVTTHGGLVSAVEGGLDSAKQGLDDVMDQRLLGTSHPLAPIISGLEREQSKLVVKGNKAGVVPIPNESAHNTLESMVAQLKQMGDSATYEDLRTLRQSWDAPAAAAKIYAKTEAEFAQKNVGQAYANGAGVLRDYLANQEPEAAKANAKYSLWINAHKVLAAAEQAGVTSQPGVGQSLVTRGIGVLAGKQSGGGIPAEIAGALIAPMLDRALSSLKTGFKVKTAQQFADLADALTGGNPTTIGKRMQAIKDSLGPMKTTLQLGVNSGQFAGQAPPNGGGDQPQQDIPVKAATPPPATARAATPPPR